MEIITPKEQIRKFFFKKHFDGTVLPKTKPSSKAKRPTQGAGWYYSHLQGKVIYGHQVHAAIVGTGETSLCYSLKRCCPECGTKIDMTLETIHSLPAGEDAYVLADSWYTTTPFLAPAGRRAAT